MGKKEEENTHSQCVSVPLFSTACSFCLPPCVSSGANTQTMLYVDCYCASWGDRLSASRVRVHANRSSINGLLTYIRLPQKLCVHLTNLRHLLTHFISCFIIIYFIASHNPLVSEIGGFSLFQAFSFLHSAVLTHTESLTSFSFSLAEHNSSLSFCFEKLHCSGATAREEKWQRTA